MWLPVSLVIRIRDAAENTEAVVGERIAEEHAAVRRRLAFILRVRGGPERRQAQARLIERLRELHVDRRTDRAGRQARIGRLHDVDLADEVRADGAEIEAAARVAARVTAERGGHLAPVVERRVEARAEAAHGDLRGSRRSKWACRRGGCAAADRDARNSLERGGEIRVRELADVFRRDRVDDAERIFLDIEASLQRGAQSRNHDLLQLIARCIGRCACAVLTLIVGPRIAATAAATLLRLSIGSTPLELNVDRVSRCEGTARHGGSRYRYHTQPGGNDSSCRRGVRVSARCPVDVRARTWPARGRPLRQVLES